MTNASFRQRGFGYLLLLFALVLFGIVLAGIGRTWTQASQRERETELLFIGHEFSNALASYRDRTPSGQPAQPRSLDDLIEDKRFPFPVRHLRRIYKDPMTRQADWQTIVVQGGIVAIHSSSHVTPLRQNVPDYVTFQPADADKPTYADWVFARKTQPNEVVPQTPSNATQPKK